VYNEGSNSVYALFWNLFPEIVLSEGGLPFLPKSGRNYLCPQGQVEPDRTRRSTIFSGIYFQKLLLSEGERFLPKSGIYYLCPQRPAQRASLGQSAYDQGGWNNGTHHLCGKTFPEMATAAVRRRSPAQPRSPNSSAAQSMPCISAQGRNYLCSVGPGRARSTRLKQWAHHLFWNFFPENRCCAPRRSPLPLAES
jgi:hypothetical protein